MSAVAEATSENVGVVASDARASYLRSFITQEIEIAVGVIETIDEELRSIGLESFLCAPFEEQQEIKLRREYLERLGTALSGSGDTATMPRSLVGLVSQIAARETIDIEAPVDVSFEGTCNSSEKWAINSYYGRGGIDEAGEVIAALVGEFYFILRDLVFPMLSSIGETIQQRKRVEETMQLLNEEKNRNTIDQSLSVMVRRLEDSRASGRLRATVAVIHARDQFVKTVRKTIVEQWKKDGSGELSGPGSCSDYTKDTGDYLSFAGCHDDIWGSSKSVATELLRSAEDFDRFEEESSLLLGAAYRLYDVWEEFKNADVSAGDDEDLKVLALFLVGLLDSVGKLSEERKEQVDEVEIEKMLADILRLLFESSGG